MSDSAKMNSQESSLCSSCPALEAEIAKLKAAMQIMDANVTHFATRANQAEAQLAALQEQIDQVYALARGPIEQAKAIPLGQWVKTRFVHIEDFNEQIISREDREKVAQILHNWSDGDWIDQATEKEARRLLQLEDGP